MPFVAAAGVARVAIDFINAQADRATNVFHVQNDGASPWTAGNITSLIADVTAWLTNEWATVAAQAWQSDLITVRALDEEFGLFVTSVVTVAGDVVSEPLPSQNTVAVSLRTGFSGRSRRGRIFHVGLAENATTGSYLIGAGAAAITAVYQELIDNTFVTDPMAIGVLSYIADGAPRVTPLFTPYTNAVMVDTIVDSQDRRKPRPA